MKLLYNRDTVNAAVKNLANVLHSMYENRNPIFLVVMKGGFFFAADLLKLFPLQFRFQLETVKCSSYGENESPLENVTIEFDNGVDFSKRHVVILDDLTDTCNTVQSLRCCDQLRNCLSVAVCVLIDKHGKRTSVCNPEYAGIRHYGDDFLFGYGMGVGEKYRHLPEIYTE